MFKKCSQTERSFWPDVGQTLVRLWSDFGQTSVRPLPDLGQTWAKLWSDFGLTSVRPLPDLGQTWARLWSDFGQTPPDHPGPAWTRDQGPGTRDQPKLPQRPWPKVPFWITPKLPPHPFCKDNPRLVSGLGKMMRKFPASCLRSCLKSELFFSSCVCD